MTKDIENATILLLTEKNIELQQKLSELQRLVDVYREAMKRPTFANMTDAQIVLLAQLLIENMGRLGDRKEFVN